MVEDAAELRVSRVQEAVGPGGPAPADGGHGGQITLQAQEVLLHLEARRGWGRAS